MFKNMRLVTLCDMFLNPSFKMTASFANVARTTASASKFIYQERLGIKSLDIKKEKKKYLISFHFLYWVGLHYNEFFYFLFHDSRSNTVHTMSKLQVTQGRHDGAMEAKSKLYLRIILLINYIMEENLFVYVEYSSVKHAASLFSARKKCHKRKESDTWMD